MAGEAAGKVGLALARRARREARPRRLRGSAAHSGAPRPQGPARPAVAAKSGASVSIAAARVAISSTAGLRQLGVPSVERVGAGRAAADAADQRVPLSEGARVAPPGLGAGRAKGSDEAVEVRAPRGGRALDQRETVRHEDRERGPELRRVRRQRAVHQVAPSLLAIDRAEELAALALVLDRHLDARARGSPNAIVSRSARVLHERPARPM